MNSLLVMDAILLERIGSLHLVLLHLPIGFVVAAGMLELSKWWRPSVDGTIYPVSYTHLTLPTIYSV